MKQISSEAIEIHEVLNFASLFVSKTKVKSQTDFFTNNNNWQIQHAYFSWFHLFMIIKRKHRTHFSGIEIDNKTHLKVMHLIPPYLYKTAEWMKGGKFFRLSMQQLAKENLRKIRFTLKNRHWKQNDNHKQCNTNSTELTRNDCDLLTYIENKINGVKIVHIMKEMLLTW